MKCIIFLDTNSIYTVKEESLKEVFNDNILKIYNFIKENCLTNKVQIYLPEIVFKERLQQKIENIHSAVNIANNNIKKLSELGHKNKIIEQKKDYSRNLKKEAGKFLYENNVKLVPVPKIESDELIERAVHKIKPFKSQGVGFKDTLIFLTLIDSAIKEDAEHYILCTKNISDFCEETQIEFKNKTGKNLTIVEGIIEIEEKLDDVFTLRLKRKERDQAIKNTVFKKIGELMVAVNKINGNTSADDYLGWRQRNQLVISDMFPYMNLEEKTKITGYDFEDIQISSIEELSSSKFDVILNIKAKIRYENENNSIPLGPFVTESFGTFSEYNKYAYGNINLNKPLIENFTVNLQCNPDIEEISIKSIL